MIDPSRLARWVTEVDGDLYVGGEFRARITRGWDGIGRVEVCEPQLLLASYDATAASLGDESGHGSLPMWSRRPTTP